MAHCGLTCNGIAVNSVAEFEAALAGVDPAEPVEVRCPTIFPEIAIECRDLLRTIGFNAMTIAIRDHLFTAVGGCIPSVDAWVHACGRESLPAANVRVAIKSHGRQFRADKIRWAAEAVRLRAAAPPRPAVNSDIPARISSAGAVALDAATWATHTIIT
jgi:hypothetical protein